MMKASPLLASLVALLIAPGSACAGRSQGGPSNGAGPYFGQKPPGTKSKLFAPGIVSTANLEHSRIVFSPGGIELFWAVVPVAAGRHDKEEQNIWHARMTSGHWSAPAKLLLPQPINRAPALSPDGTVLYYLSPDPRAGQGGGVPAEQLWEVKKEAGGWGTPKMSELPLPNAPGKMVMSFCLAGDGDLYFDLGGPGADGKWGWRIYVSSLKDGRYLRPTPLGDGINEGTINQCPFVPLDESYLVFSSNREEGIGDWDLYISFKGEDGRWGRPVNMGVSINSGSQDRFPSVSPDGKYLFFARPNGDRMDDVFWVDAGIIGRLRGESERAQAPSPVMDGHNHEVLEFQEGKVSFSGVKGTKARGIHGSIFPLPVDRSPSKSLEVRIAEEINQIRLAAKTDRGFSVDEDPASLLTERIDEGLHLFLSIEWNGPIFGGDPASVQRYRSLGVRIICPMEKDSDALFEQDGSSLSLFGKQVLSAMNMAGVLFDITHLSHKQKLLIIALSELPVVASHSLVQSVTPLNFSLPDEVLSALASKGGSVWVSFNRRELLGEAAENCALDRLADNIDVLFKRLGPDHVGIGTDLQGDPNTVPAILNGIDAFSKIRECLKARGYSEILIDKIFWKNVLQALQRTEGQAGNHPSSSCPLKMTADNSSFKRGEMINDTPGLINGKEQIAARR